MMAPDDHVFQELLYSGALGGDPVEEVLEEVLGDRVEEVSEEVPEEVEAEAEGHANAVSVQQPMTCTGCGELVCDRFFLLVAGSVWHSTCLCCSCCRCELQSQPSLFWRDGRIYCQQDYCRTFGGGQCARCFQPIPASDLVMRSGELTFHPQCFSCQECDVTLMPGNLYCMQGPHLYCQSHYQAELSVPLQHDLQPRAELGDGESRFRDSESRFRDGQNPASGDGDESVSSPEPRLDDMLAGGRSRRRTKRIRTCFRSEQLRALESYFAQKHNPDGKDWTCLAHKTGLPKRVLQVWFQNARAKLRRSLSSDDSQVNSPSGPLRAVTMATSSPPGLVPSPPDQSHVFPTSTIDQVQLSLLTAPLGETPANLLLQSPAYFLDNNSQDAPRHFASLEDCVEEGAGGGGGGAGAEGDPLSLVYC